MRCTLAHITHSCTVLKRGKKKDRANAEKKSHANNVIIKMRAKCLLSIQTIQCENHFRFSCYPLFIIGHRRHCCCSRRQRHHHDH